MVSTGVYPTRSQLQEAAAYVRARCPVSPRLAIVLGSGLSALADDIVDSACIPYAEVPNFPRSTVQGHVGQLVMGALEAHHVLAMQGRVHYYEGYTMQQVAFPIRVMRMLGIETLIVTNAAGGLNPDWSPGDLMLISDHISLVGMTGGNPLIGPNDPELGPRFPDMSQAYDPDLREIAHQVAQSEQIPLREGVYACLSGPSFETPAEIRFLRVIGASAVGMSTAPEVTVARHMGMRVLGISGISNVHAADASPAQKTSHEEVLAASAVIAPRLRSLVRGVLRRL